jgi:hypothetical protein
MTLRRAATVALLALALLGAALTPQAATAAVAPDGPKAGQAVYWNLGNPEVRPQRIFTAYSSAAYLDRLKWKRWGTRHAVARGVLISDCASCSPPARRKVTLHLTGFATCDDDPTLRTYRKAVAKVSKPDTGETSTTWKLFAGCP